ncbi:MAG: hypothetical protein IH820_06920 [Bacteroidetes bacterium]|nr:hypothetical protein [Bacteroidota bacterium]
MQTSWTGEQFELPAGDGPRIGLAGWLTEEAAARLTALGGRDLEALVAAAARAGAQGLMAHAVFLKPSAQRVFFPFLARRFPHLLRRYRRWYGRGAYAPEDYRRALSATMRRLRARYGIKAPPRDGAAGQPDHGARMEQMELGWTGTGAAESH